MGLALRSERTNSHFVVMFLACLSIFSTYCERQVLATLFGGSLEEQIWFSRVFPIWGSDLGH